MPLSRRDIRPALRLVAEPARLRPPSDFADAVIAAAAAARAWTAAPGVQGVGIGERLTVGKSTGELALKVYVAEKLPRRKLDRPAPGEIEIPWTGTAVPVDVEEIGHLRLEALKGRVRPAIPGCAITVPGSTPGTMGCLVRDLTPTDHLYLLSNAHVIANNGSGPSGIDVLQPGAAAAPDERIGRLHRWRPFIFSESGFPNEFDAAIAKVESGAVSAEIYRVGRPTGFSNVVVRGMQVQKAGAESGHTIGIVRDIDFTWAAFLPRKGGGSGRVGFRNQVLCSRFTEGGDSGAVVLNMKGRVVGLHFAGASGGSVFNRIVPILKWLAVRIA